MPDKKLKELKAALREKVVHAGSRGILGTLKAEPDQEEKLPPAGLKVGVLAKTRRESKKRLLAEWKKDIFDTPEFEQLDEEMKNFYIKKYEFLKAALDKQPKVPEYKGPQNVQEYRATSSEEREKRTSEYVDTMDFADRLGYAGLVTDKKLREGVAKYGRLVTPESLLEIPDIPYPHSKENPRPYSEAPDKRRALKKALFLRRLFEKNKGSK